MKSNTLSALIVAIVMASCATAQIFSPGTCPDGVKSVESFDVEKYLGLWYEYAKYSVFFEADGKCITAQYSLGEDGIVNVKNSLVNEKTNEPDVINGNATLVAPGKLLVKFPVSPVVTVTSNYWVLDTDYENYSVVYSCSPMSEDSHSTIVWILTRERIPEPRVLKEAVSVLKANNISLLPLKITNQISC